MKLKNNNGMWCFSADKEHTPLIIFCMKNSDFPTLYPETFSSCVCHQGAYRFGSPVLTRWLKSFHDDISKIRCFEEFIRSSKNDVG